MKKQTDNADQNKINLQALKESEARFRSIILWSPDAIIVTDAKGMIEYMNPAAEKVFNRKTESFIGKDFGLPLVNGETTEIDIYRLGKDPGVGDMYVVETEWLGEKAHLITIRDITGRKRTEEELRNSEGKYRLLADNVHDVIFVLDMNLKYTYISPSVKILRGYEPEEVLKQQSIEQTLTPSSQDLAMRTFSEIMEQEKTGRREISMSRTLQLEMRRKDGTTVWTEVKFSFIRDEDQRAVGIMGVTRDITERKQAEMSLRESEDKYKSLINNVPDIILTINMEGKITFVNKRAKEILGYEDAEAINMYFFNFIPEEDRQRAIENLPKGMKGEKIKHIQTPIIAKSGEKVFFDCSFTRIYKDGVVIGAQCTAVDITERKLAEDALRQSEEKYRTILEDIQEGYFEVDFAGNFTFFNDSLCRFLGYSKEELMGMNNRQYTDKEHSKELFQTFNKVYTTGKTTEGFDWQIIRKDGTKRYVEASVSLQKDSSGKPIGFRGIARDVTERKRVDEALRESEEKYRGIIENMQEGYFETDLTGNFTFVNDAVCELMGYSREELIGKNNRQFANEESSKKIYQAFNKIYRTGEAAKGIEHEYIRKDGIKGFTELSISLVRDEEGKPIGFRCISHDITERKQADETLRESEEKYRNILEGMDDVYFEVDIKGNITFVNRSSCKMSGYSKEELLGMSFKKISVTDGIEKVSQYFGEIFLTGKTGKPFLWNLEKKNGEQGFFELIASLINDKQGKPIGFRGIGRDVTERRKAEAKLQQTLESLKKAVGTTIQVLVSAVEMRDPYTSGHQTRSADLARSIATEMGLAKDKIDGIRMAGSIHDIGKLSVPAEILSKPTKLTNIEFSLIKEHSQIGYEMLKDVESPWPLAQIVYQHHERMDGSGYPRNLKGDEILMESRILAVADVVEAMASHRPYRAALGIDTALEEIVKNKGIFYDDAVADACLKLFREKGYQLS